MEMNRQTFTRRLAVLLVASWGGAWRAVRTRLFPGRVRPLDPRKIRRPGRWAG